MAIYSCPDRDFHTLASQADSFSAPKMPHIPTEERKSIKGMHGAEQRQEEFYPAPDILNSVSISGG